MNFRNPTKNQHYISQAEQKLNAIDPSAPRDKREIYEFEIVRRDPPVLSPPTRRRIEHSLSALDLFSFDVIDRQYRDNLEGQFQTYEQQVADHSVALLQKLGNGSLDLKKELVEVFAAKFLNMLRNPFSVNKVLNTVGEVARFEPTDPALRALLANVASGSRPHEANVCAEYGITSETYERWLRVLFMLLGPRDDRNLFEDTAARLFNNSYVTVQVFEYKDSDPSNICLLSDRGVGFVTSKDDEAIFAFNITSKSFAIYGFTDPAKRAPQLPPAATDGLRGQVVVRHTVGDLGALGSFNERSIFYAAHTVLASGPAPRLS